MAGVICARPPNFLFAALDRTACAPFLKERRIKFREPTKLDRKFGHGCWGRGSHRVGAWNRIETTLEEGIAPQQTPQGQRGAMKHSVIAHGKYCIFRASGLKAASPGSSTHRMHERGNPPPVEVNHEGRRSFFHFSR
jgi:hypothetical protein